METGIRVSGLMRDYLVIAGIDYDKAVELSQQFDEQIKEMDWLETYNGTTFEKSFTPSLNKK